MGVAVRGGGGGGGRAGGIGELRRGGRVPADASRAPRAPAGGLRREGRGVGSDEDESGWRGA